MVKRTKKVLFSGNFFACVCYMHCPYFSIVVCIEPTNLVSNLNMPSTNVPVLNGSMRCSNGKIDQILHSVVK